MKSEHVSIADMALEASVTEFNEVILLPKSGAAQTCSLPHLASLSHLLVRPPNVCGPPPHHHICKSCLLLLCGAFMYARGPCAFLVPRGVSVSLKLELLAVLSHEVGAGDSEHSGSLCGALTRAPTASLTKFPPRADRIWNSACL